MPFICERCKRSHPGGACSSFGIIGIIAPSAEEEGGLGLPVRTPAEVPPSLITLAPAPRTTNATRNRRDKARTVSPKRGGDNLKRSGQETPCTWRFLQNLDAHYCKGISWTVATTRDDAVTRDSGRPLRRSVPAGRGDPTSIVAMQILGARGTFHGDDHKNELQSGM